MNSITESADAFARTSPSASSYAASAGSSLENNSNIKNNSDESSNQDSPERSLLILDALIPKADGAMQETTPRRAKADTLSNNVTVTTTTNTNPFAPTDEEEGTVTGKEGNSATVDASYSSCDYTTSGSDSLTVTVTGPEGNTATTTFKAEENSTGNLGSGSAGVSKDTTFTTPQGTTVTSTFNVGDQGGRGSATKTTYFTNSEDTNTVQTDHQLIDDDNTISMSAWVNEDGNTVYYHN